MAEKFKPQKSTFNPDDLIEYSRLRADDQNYIVDPQTRLVALKESTKKEAVVDPAESELADLQKRATQYILSNGLSLTTDVSNRMKFEITSQMILRTQPKTKAELTILISIVGRLLKASITSEEILLGYNLTQLREITSIGEKAINKLKNWYFPETNEIVNVRESAEQYLRDHGITLNPSIENNLNQELGSYIILQMQPSDKANMTHVTRLCHLLFQKSILTIEDLRKYESDLYAIGRIGEVYHNHLQNILAKYPAKNVATGE
jgi:hypothetical protein